MEYAIDKCQVKGLISDTVWGKQNYIEILNDAMKKCKSLKFVVFMNNDSRHCSSTLTESNLRTYQFTDLYNGGGSNDFNELERIISKASVHDISNILFTSGTTGKPKGAALTHHNVQMNALGSIERIGTSIDDAYLVNVPFYHVFGCVSASHAMSIR